MSKQKKAARCLVSIVSEMRTTLRDDVANIIKRGELLREAKDQLEHGQWLPWLEDNFDMGERSAQRAMLVAEFAAKYDRLTDLNLTKGALYALASGEYPANVIQAVIARGVSELPASSGHSLFTESTLDDINAELNPEPVGDEEPDEQDEDDQEAEEQSEDEAEAEDILDGPPPDLPPSAEPPRPADFTLAQFDKAVKSLAELHTKSVRKFIGSAHSGDELKKIADFLCAVAAALNGKTLRRIGTDRWELLGGLQ